ncbi:hypothetical protein [Flavilitoribacter nigricans]|uniref:Uncharacterized protein n=1 Tax=Flavilitoribacter nigricans (strain ATCC 23147 / DSM 23189 / NBRC 102662 / NCIMB 1420 / SS-2) TaxID=1122177 RepID=A0A2D0N7N7_FLAN2|nr:hypothetical protein [Flavilitoribacter nigricans]PHN04149.1 hypothetical protein CRP01_23420 [Flavilitoribacter nigricans DSM 23189 = NBRC 102662]
MLLLPACRDNAPLVLEPVRTEPSSHLGYGVWVSVPYGFREASSYNGFQNTAATASISLQVNEIPPVAMKKNFDPELLARRKTELLEMRPVYYGDFDSAFFAVVRDKRKRTIRYLLCVSDGTRTYNIKAFCFEDQAGLYGSALKNALLTAYIGEYEEEKEEKDPFQLAGVVDAQTIVFTRDGKFPTEAEDQAKLEIERLDESRSFLSREERYELVRNEMEKLTQNRPQTVQHDPLKNGVFLYASGYGEAQSVYVALLVDADGSSTVIRGTGTTSSSVSEIEEFVRASFLKTVIKY